MRLSVTISERLHSLVSAEARQQEKTLAQVIRDALVNYFDPAPSARAERTRAERARVRDGVPDTP